ncbi:MAG: hypothetical protein H6555_07980 [Lewinellaceae bacterium]|nr:hypothetical protein [Lewinellaceae bacterium]
MQVNKPSRKKIRYPIQPPLLEYLEYYNRLVKLPLSYDDLVRYSSAIPLLDQEGNDTYWETVFYPENEQKEIYQGLKYIYALLKTEGDVEVIQHLTISRIDYCIFGNSKPFRIRIINRINDNYDHFYIKVADASRIYGLELEALLSPNSVMYYVDGHTLIEEHIAGIPGDDFLRTQLNTSTFNKIRIAKEFVKFNERCFVRLLGDMRSYNFVVDITPDIEGNQYRMRAIDFDQQSYEGRKSFYLPQFFKENNPVIFLGIKHMSPESLLQYQQEEHSLMSARVKIQQERVNALFYVMTRDEISPTEKVIQLRSELGAHHNTTIFADCKTMGELVLTHIRFLLNRPGSGRS